MGSNFILKVRIHLKSLYPLFHKECTTVSTLKTSLRKSPHLFSCRFVGTKESNLNLRVAGSDRRKKQPAEGQKSKPGQVRDRLRTNGGRLWETSFLPKSVFAAGTAKKSADGLKRKTFLDCEDEEEREEGSGSRRSKATLEPPDRPLPPSDWRKLRDSLGPSQRFEVHMMRSLLISNAQLDIAKSLLTFVAMETGTVSYELLLGYLTLCVHGGHDAEVSDIYRIMQGSYPSLDTGASSLFIKSFSRTAEWREAVKILQEVQKVFSPSPRSYGDVIAAAASNGDASTAWALYDELIEKGLTPRQETWGALFAGLKKSDEEEGAPRWTEQQQRLLGILLYMRNNQVYPQHSTATSIKTWFESLAGQTWTGHWTSATPQGVCRCCGSELESIQLTAEEYGVLKDRVMTDVIQGRDVFNKTSPEELEDFKAFVRSKAAFDVVVDGLNVANIHKDKSRMSEVLLAVVSELSRQGLAVLVLGRKHMLRPSRSWDRHNMKLIQQKAHCFFTDNLSEDDPFLLYAALHSGNDCRFVSRDLMRDHKACLPDGAPRRLFFKWQRGHQLVVDGFSAGGRRVRFQSVPSYDTIVQTTGDSWHLPYDDTADRSSYEVPQRWLCLKKKA